MNKEQLVKRVAKELDMSNKHVESVVDTVLETITVTVGDGEEVALHGFGKFEIRSRAARKGFNPSTREEMQIDESKCPGFTAGKNFKEAVKSK
ncbi:HU family DNA-binding protein [Paenibacillus chitinolyticus]|uniref:HU family DNA-binding protein n=1 Tax=Paenibacillus chitinolyticus TaxID=79263 RepID=A0A410WTD9_9BACL|nr:HU family DNA-binding protein [Paenibacillus chitinolyticus]MCY9594044.1 HU family DNA-binding protein [Paenibacillus chitinolyticus]MCY9599149.1 HU family DNA-binding protein [Paenibacillus chitinolyticus]QAV17610.1 HU family DNA-binding protein [Paenibacillus chitinolyticus]